MKNRRLTIDIILTLALIALTILGIILTCTPSVNRLWDRWFEYFTNDSAILAGFSCLLVLPFLIAKKEPPRWIQIVKFAGTVSVVLTFLTVFCYLGPIEGFQEHLSGPLFLFHLVCPLLCAATFLLDGFRPFSFRESLFGMIPMLIYGCIYFTNVILLCTWEDFYHFNNGIHWYLSLPVMLIVVFAITQGLRWLHRVL